MVNYGKMKLSLHKKHDPRSDKGTHRGLYKGNFKMGSKVSFGFGKA